MRIEGGELAAGDSLPTLRELCSRWHCSPNSARGAVALLRKQGLISGGRGKAPVVRLPPPRITRSSDRHQAEKDLALLDETRRKAVGEAETNMGVPLDECSFRADYDTIRATDDLAEAFDLKPRTELLRRVYETTDPLSGRRHSRSVSYLPLALISANKALLDPANEPWPGGTQHQLFTVDIEIIRMIDLVTSVMPTTVDVQAWRLDDGVPLLRVRRISIDTDVRVVEISDAEYPADRTELRFTTPLRKWRSPFR
jgi:GntR family transcriptional regulator